jgi:hypothetical protein
LFSAVLIALRIAWATPMLAAQWSIPVPPPAGCGSSLALNAAGAWVTAGYLQTGSTVLEAFTVYVCTSNDGVTWSGPSAIGQGVFPAVVLAPDGRAVAIWQGGPSTSPNVQASVRLAGGSWSAPVVVSTVPGHPVIRMDGSGDAIAAWAAPNLAGPVSTATLPAKGNWTAVQTLVPQGGGVEVTANSMGGAIVSWKTHSNLIQAASGTILGGFGAAVTLGSSYGHGTNAAHGALNDAGEAALGWVGGSGNMVATRTADGTWSSATQLSANPLAIATTIDGAGNAIAVFSELQTTGSPTYASLRPAGGTWGPPTLLSALNDKGVPGVGADPAGTFIVTWTSSSGTIEALTIPPGGGFGPGMEVGQGPFLNLTVIPGEAALWIGAGISKESVF